MTTGSAGEVLHLASAYAMNGPAFGVPNSYLPGMNGVTGAVDNRVPADAYVPSPRPFPDEIGDPAYPEEFEVRRTTTNGRIHHDRIEFYVGKVLGHEAVGIESIDDGRYQLWFGPIYLGLLTHLGRDQFNFDKNTPKE